MFGKLPLRCWIWPLCHRAAGVVGWVGDLGGGFPVEYLPLQVIPVAIGIAIRLMEEIQRSPVDMVPSLKLTVRTCQEAILKGNEKVFQPSIFRCYVSFREGKYPINYLIYDGFYTSQVVGNGISEPSIVCIVGTKNTLIAS